MKKIEEHLLDIIRYYKWITQKNEEILLHETKVKKKFQILKMK